MYLLLSKLLFEKAGLLMFTKEFNPFVWEEELKILDLSYFYLGINNINFLKSNDWVDFKHFSSLELGLEFHLQCFSLNIW